MVKEKLIKATWQLNRNSKILLNNLHKIHNLFKLPKSWLPTSIYKVVLTDLKVGAPTFINGCYITDITTMNMFFEKDVPRMHVNGKPQLTSNIPLEINVENLLSELYQSRILTHFEKRIGKETKNFFYEEHHISADVYAVTVPFHSYILLNDG